MPLYRNYHATIFVPAEIAARSKSIAAAFNGAKWTRRSKVGKSSVLTRLLSRLACRLHTTSASKPQRGSNLGLADCFLARG